VLRHLLDVESAWLRAQAVHRVISQERAASLEAVIHGLAVDDVAALDLATAVARDAVGGGNPVIPLLARIRAAVVDAGLDDTGLHAGLTSQDVLDTALVLMLREVSRAALDNLGSAVSSAAGLAAAFRDVPALGRTLTQAAVPTTLGTRFASWVQALGSAHRALLNAANLPAAYGGAAGTLAGAAALFDTDDRAHRALDLVNTWAHRQLGLPVQPAPGHVTRGPLLSWTGAVAEVGAALGKVASDVLLAVRPEIGELAEPSAPGRGASSAMAHKHNPVLSVLLRRSALAMPALQAQVSTAAGLAVDERPDGAWHAEWPALQQLARHLAGSARIGAELLGGLVVHREAVARNLTRHLGVPPGDADLGAAPLIVDRVLREYGFSGDR
jgi:3-carboxy-cis,cis-muconate cycloisomerase